MWSKGRTELNRKLFTSMASQDWSILPKDVGDLDEPRELKRKLRTIDL